jgi:hypothetical protein
MRSRAWLYGVADSLDSKFEEEFADDFADDLEHDLGDKFRQYLKKYPHDGLCSPNPPNGPGVQLRALPRR